jgi:hypothetical protein
LIKNFALISNSAFGRIEEVIKAQVSGIFEPIEDHEDFKIVDSVELGILPQVKFGGVQLHLEDAVAVVPTKAVENHLRTLHAKLPANGYQDWLRV